MHACGVCVGMRRGRRGQMQWLLRMTAWRELWGMRARYARCARSIGGNLSVCAYVSRPLACSLICIPCVHARV